jgi:hypothetical protein
MAQERKPEGKRTAKSWEEIFPNKTEQTAAFKTYVQSIFEDYKETYENYEVEGPIWDSSGLKASIIRRIPEEYTTELEMLRNGDILLKFIYPDKVDVDIIKAGVGDINHPYTKEDVLVPPTAEQQQRWVELMQEALFAEYGYDFPSDMCQIALQGKPATKRWLNSPANTAVGRSPVRIGFGIHPRNFVKAASQIRKSHPELFQVPIVNAKSWEDIFSTREEQLVAFKEFVHSFYPSNKSPENIDWEETKEFLKATIKRDTEGKRKTYILLFKDGDVEIRFIYPDRTDVDRIVAEVGNIHHRFTKEDTLLPPTNEQQFIWARLMEAKIGKGGAVQSIKGKSATKGWQQMRASGAVGDRPVRIGYRIYAEHIITAAHELRKERPNLFILPETPST